MRATDLMHPTPEQHGQVCALLIQTRTLLRDVTTWTSGTMARDVTGQEVQISDPRAVQFCLVGGVRRAAFLNPTVSSPSTANLALLALARVLDPDDLDEAMNRYGDEAPVTLAEAMDWIVNRLTGKNDLGHGRGDVPDEETLHRGVLDLLDRAIARELVG